MTQDRPGASAQLFAAVAAGGMIVCAVGSALAGHPRVVALSTSPVSAVESPPVQYQDRYVTNTEERFRVTSPAKMRNLPTADGTTITGTFSPGTILTGRQVYAVNGDHRWLRTEQAGGIGYVWSGNLAAEEATATAEVSTARSDVAASEPVSPNRAETEISGERPARQPMARDLGADEPRVACILPNGQEARMSREACIQNAGVVPN